MNLEQIKAEAHDFFEWPTEDRTVVLTTSAILFARHCADIERERISEMVRTMGGPEAVELLEKIDEP
jgi:hypothetical protein